MESDCPHSAAFDTVDIDIIFYSLEHLFGFLVVRILPVPSYSIILRQSLDCLTLRCPTMFSAGSAPICVILYNFTRFTSCLDYDFYGNDIRQFIPIIWQLQI